MLSNSVFYTLFIAFGLILLINSIHAASVHNKDINDDSTGVKSFDDDQDDGHSTHDFADEFPALLLAQHRLASRGIRLPSESILLGKRRLPVEAVLLGRRALPNEGILLGKRR